MNNRNKAREMALHPHLNDFYNEWLTKADNYDGQQLSDYFNKAFSLFTLYNKLYAEATFELARRNVITLSNTFPDRKGATEYAPKFIGYMPLYIAITDDQNCSDCLQSLIGHISEHNFYIKLSMPYGEPQIEKDNDLVKRLNSKIPSVKVTAILDLIYSVRCNMFHGNKQFDHVQVELLSPITVILRAVIITLYAALRDEL